MKWKELKARLEKKIKDDDEIAWIEVFHFEDLLIEKRDGGWVVEDL